MRQSILIFLCLLLSVKSLHAQYQWRHKACLPASARAGEAAFTVGGKGYIVAGNIASGPRLTEVWQYNQSTDTWLQKNNFPMAITGVACFVINDTAYVGTGLDYSGVYHQEFWQYNAGSDQWNQITSFPGAVRYLAASFSINDTGYVGCGKGGTEYGDFYAYNPAGNFWSQVASFPGAVRQNTFEASVGNYGYVGLGFGLAGTPFSDIYRYSPSTGSWTPMSNFGGAARFAPGFFVINDTIYVAAGKTFSNYFEDCWRYDIPGDTWIQEADFSCIAPPRSTTFGFAIGKQGYITCGDFGNGIYANDLLQFGPVDTTFVKRVHVLGSDTSYCGNIHQTLSTGNLCTVWSTGAIDSQIIATTPGTYWAYWADTCGVVSDTIQIISGGGISVNLGPDTSICNSQTLLLNAANPGASYTWSTGVHTQTISVSSSGTYAVTVSKSGCSGSDTIDVSAYQLHDSLLTVNSSCSLSNGSIQVIVSGGHLPVTFHWNNGDTTAVITNLSAANYSVTVTDKSGCTLITDTTVNSLVAPMLSITPLQTTVCPGDTVQLCATSGFISYQWSSGDSTACIQTTYAGNYYVTAFDAPNCSAVSGRAVIRFFPVSPVSISITGDTLTCYNASEYQWYFNNNPLPGDTDSVLIATQTGDYRVRIKDGNGCYVSSNNTFINVSGLNTINQSSSLLIFPNPSNGEWAMVVDNALLGSEAEVYDIDGELLYKTKITRLNTWLRLSAPGGIYLLKVTSGNIVMVKRLVKL